MFEASSFVVYLDEKVAAELLPDHHHHPSKRSTASNRILANMLEYLIAILIMIVSFGFLAIFSMPVQGSIVRLRANFAPRGLALSDIEGGDPRVGPAVRKVWGMIARVKRLEGWMGLYKGEHLFAMSFERGAGRSLEGSSGG